MVCTNYVNSINTVAKAWLLAVTSPHSDDLLHSLPLSSRGLHWNDSVIHTAIGVRLGVNICQLQQFPCGTTVNFNRFHTPICSKPRLKRPHLACTVNSQHLAIKASPTLLKFDRRQHGRWVICDVIASDRPTDAVTSGRLVCGGQQRQQQKGRQLNTSSLPRCTHSYRQLQKPSNWSTARLDYHFLSDVGRCISWVSDNYRESIFLFQCLSVLIKWFNAVAMPCIFAHTPTEDKF